MAQRSDVFPFPGFISNLAAEAPVESSSCGLELFSPFTKLGHIENVLPFRATGLPGGSVCGKRAVSVEEGKLNLALPGIKSPLVLPQQEPTGYFPAVRGAQAASRSKARPFKLLRTQPSQPPRLA